MVTQVQALTAIRWSVGHAYSPVQAVVLGFEFPTQAPINIALLPHEAALLAKAILDQLATPPPTPDRMN